MLRCRKTTINNIPHGWIEVCIYFIKYSRYNLTPEEYVITVNDDSVEESYQQMST